MPTTHNKTTKQRVRHLKTRTQKQHKHSKMTQPASLPCPYHDPIFRLQPAPTTLADATPMGRFLAAPPSEHPVVFGLNVKIGTATSAGCTCSLVSDETLDRLTQIAMALCDEPPDFAAWYALPVPSPAVVAAEQP